MSRSASKLELLWNDCRCLKAYLIGTAATAVWLKFGIMVAQGGTLAAWMR